MDKLGIIGGTGLIESDLFDDFSKKEISNTTDIYIKEDLVFLQRHGREKNLPPHLIDNKRNISSLNEEGVEKIISISSVGSLKGRIIPGTVVIPSDYINFFNPSTFYENEKAHTVPGLDEDLRYEILDCLSDVNIDYIDGGIYFQTRGPRLETKAEIDMIKEFADIVGMTMGAEATLAKEIGISYAAVSVVDNYAHGVGDTPLSIEEVEETVKQNLQEVEKIVEVLVDKMLGDKDEYFN